MKSVFRSLFTGLLWSTLNAQGGVDPGFLIYPALLITGGLHSDRKAEVFFPPYSCKLPDLPESRYYHTQNGFLTCGGGNSQKTCNKWDPETGTWPLSHNLPSGRSELSWTTGSGTYLIGGYWENWDHAETTTLVKRDGTVVPGFKVNRTEYMLHIFKASNIYD